MMINTKISEYVVFENETIFKALEKINSNKKQIVFILADTGVLIGCLTDGDFRRWITVAQNFDMNISVSEIMNSNISWMSTDAGNVEIMAKFSDSVNAIPIVDSSHRLVSIAFENDEGFTIGGRVISSENPAFIIAEIGNNHNGDFDLAKKLVDLAFDAGAECVKFQMRDVTTLYKSSGQQDSSADLGVQYTMDLLSKFQLSNNDLFKVFDYCKTKGLTPLCTPWDIKSLEALEAYGMEFYKVASADFTNHPFLEALINTGKPLICSTGMSSEPEIKQTINFLKKKGATFILLHCNSTYPTPFKDVNLSYIDRLKRLSNGLIGYSGHERGTAVPVAAVALGAKIVEKHFTIDQTMEGNDHKVSLLPSEFKRMVTEIRAVEESIGIGNSRELSQGEMLNRESLAKSIIAKRKIKSGEIIKRDMIDFKSPGQGLQPMYIDKLLGRNAKRAFKEGDFFYESDLISDTIKARNYNFSRPFGIPVRYHDYEELSKKSNFDFVEFHLSYQDMELKLEDFFSAKQKINFAVHSPELFDGDHILDLTSQNSSYRDHSILELQRVCDITRELKRYFPKTTSPKIVVNAGGFSSNGFLPAEEISQRYKTLESSLASINQDGVEIIIQTMPPFPWHFGGQSYHNLFVDSQEIVKFCVKTNYRVCFDISHTMMACNHYNWDLSDFTRLIGPHIAHMHVVDAKGSDGEGVKIGSGDVNFSLLAKDLSEVAPNVMFLPEVWQGHKNSGEGFWEALEFLENKQF